MLQIERPWAFWRRVQYGTLFVVLWALFITGIYYQYFYTPASCFDGVLNGAEAEVDCGGSCVRICAFSVKQPTVLWAKSFVVIGDQYNAVAYIENQNTIAASPEVNYTFRLYDGSEIVAERSGTTILPPGSQYPIFEDRISTGGHNVTRTELELEPPALWQPATVGRDQFVVNDRRLYDADGRPRLEATIENRALFEAKEAEVVATIFDARGNPLTASRTFVDNFAPQSQTAITFTWPTPIAKTLRSCEVPTDVVLAIDLSGSMNNDGGEPPEPISSVLSAAGTFSSQLKTGDRAALVTFATEAVVQLTLTPTVTAITDSIRSLSIDPAEERGSTNTGAAFEQALAELSSSRHNSEARKVLVLLTDGLATAPEEDPEAFALTAAAAAKEAGIIVYTIGLGKEVNMDFVRAVATTPNQAYQAVTRDQVSSIYETIKADICEDGAAVIDIVPKTTASFTPLR